MSLSLTFLYSVLRSEASQSPNAVPFPVASLTLPRPAGGIPGPVTNVSDDWESAIGLPLVSKHTLWDFHPFWPLAVTRSSAALAFESDFACEALLFDALNPVMASVPAATSGAHRAICPFIGASPLSCWFCERCHKRLRLPGTHPAGLGRNYGGSGSYVKRRGRLRRRSPQRLGFLDVPRGTDRTVEAQSPLQLGVGLSAAALLDQGMGQPQPVASLFADRARVAHDVGRTPQVAGGERTRGNVPRILVCRQRIDQFGPPAQPGNCPRKHMQIGDCKADAAVGAQFDEELIDERRRARVVSTLTEHVR